MLELEKSIHDEISRFQKENLDKEDFLRAFNEFLSVSLQKSDLPRTLIIDYAPFYVSNFNKDLYKYYIGYENSKLCVRILFYDDTVKDVFLGATNILELDEQKYELFCSRLPVFSDLLFNY